MISRHSCVGCGTTSLSVNIHTILYSSSVADVELHLPWKPRFLPRFWTLAWQQHRMVYPQDSFAESSLSSLAKTGKCRNKPWRGLLFISVIFYTVNELSSIPMLLLFNMNYSACHFSSSANHHSNNKKKGRNYINLLLLLFGSEMVRMSLKEKKKTRKSGLCPPGTKVVLSSESPDWG